MGEMDVWAVGVSLTVRSQIKGLLFGDVLSIRPGAHLPMKAINQLYAVDDDGPVDNTARLVQQLRRFRFLRKTLEESGALLAVANLEVSPDLPWTALMLNFTSTARMLKRRFPKLRRAAFLVEPTHLYQGSSRRAPSPLSLFTPPDLYDRYRKELDRRTEIAHRLRFGRIFNPDEPSPPQDLLVFDNEVIV